jgi:4-hydroxy-tetrahydrodipicolinate reductase
MPFSIFYIKNFLNRTIMNAEIVVSGYGKMGREIESVLLGRGVNSAVITEDICAVPAEKAQNSVCIDFTTPAAFRANYKFIASSFRAAVVGTTGWNDIKDEVRSCFEREGKTLIYASNFSTGVNIFFKLAEISSKLTSALANYDNYILEMHHRQKLDAPSGTAKTIASAVQMQTGKPVEIQAVRAGSIFGIHELGFESVVDRITIRHEAFSRRGFAEGAVMAAEWANEMRGIYEFRELLEEKFKKILGYE